MKKWLISLAAVLVLGGGLLYGISHNSTSDSNDKSSTKSGDRHALVVGSTAMQPLAEHVAEKFKKENPKYDITVQGGGSGSGLTQVQSGAVQIGNSDVFAEEKSGIDAKKLVDHKAAVVGFAPIVNDGVSVKNLTMSQLRDIFTGKITNWKEVGGKDQKIVVINRAEGSGTRSVFESIVLDGQKAGKFQEQDSNGAVKKIVSTTPGAISYVSFSYIDKSVKSLQVDGVKPTVDNVTTNDWKIWGYEHMYTRGEPTGVTKKFLDYFLGDEVQKNMISSLGNIPVSQMKVEKDVNGNVTNN